MCGFVGFIGDFDNDLLESSIRSIQHRGPDDTGSFFNAENSIGFGFSRLAIQDLTKAGHQPMMSDDESVVIVFNGEIYNVNHLRDSLELKGYTFNSTSDTEVLIKMYLHYGLDMLNMLDGMFSISIWDSNNQELILIKDAYGIKPLYYFESDNGFIFGSEIKAIMSISGKFNTLNKDALMKYMTFLWCPDNSTAVQKLYKVNPGELLIFSGKKLKEKRLWAKDFLSSKTKLKKYSTSDYIAEVRDALKTAVSNQLISDVPVGAFLSGGLDSSAVVAFAREKNPDIECFTIEQVGGADQGQVSDLFYAHKVAKHLDVSLNVVSVDSYQLIENIEKMIWHLDEPLADPAALNVFFISKLARDSGIKVLLSGAGGDDLFTGYRRHALLNYKRIFNPLVPDIFLTYLSNISEKFNKTNHIFRKISKVLSGVHLKDDDQIINLFKWISRYDLVNLFNKEFTENINLDLIDQPMRDYLSGISDSNIVSRALELDRRFFLPDHNFTYTDKMSMAAGIEVRVPFLDNNLFQVSNGIPMHLKQTFFQGKWVLKKALEGTLPSNIIYRPKTGFGAPLRRWIGHDLKPMIAEYLSDKNIKERGIFDPKMVRNLITNTENGRIDGSYTIFSILCIEIWCRKFIKSASI